MAHSGYPEVRRLEQIVRRWGAATPGKQAVVCGKASLTYGELDRVSDAVAARLAAAGVGPGDRVGLYVPKGVEATAALYGVLKAGAAHVPLDTTGPVARSLGIVGQCGIRHLVCGLPQYRKLSVDAHRLEGLGLELTLVLVAKDLPDDAPPPDPLAHVDRTERLCLPHALRAAPEGVPPPAGDADATAYILYTSGSTGRPKGVSISHRTALFFVRWAARRVGLTEQDRCSNHAPLFFDLSTFDFYSCMLAGGTTVIVPPAYSAFPRNLGEYIETQRITTWYSVPATLMDLMQGDDLSARDLSALRTIIYAGEAFPVGPLRRLFDVLPGRAVHNWYGPTETNVCTAYVLPGRPRPGASEVPIGEVVEGLVGLLLDERGGVVAGEGEGELAIAGDAVMQGYFGMPEETARVMVELPGVGPGYLTGDLVRRDADGLLWFVGRKDTMVKVSGFRVELGEVEAALSELPGVGESCVVAVPTADGTRRLVAVVVPAGGAGSAGGGDFDADAILAALQGALPKYMIPAEVVTRDHLPRTATGKVNRRGLVAEL